MVTRREFLWAGLGAAVATRAHALPGDRMRYAMSGHQFRTTPPHPETGIKMAARYGYHGLEPFEDDMPRYLEQPPEVFKHVLDASGLALCTIGSGGQYLEPGPDRGDDEEQCRPAPDTSRISAARHLKVNLSKRVSEGNLTAADGRSLARNLNEVGKRTADDGIRFAFHPHAWTLVEAPAGARHGDGDDRSQARVSRARHRPRDVGRHRSVKCLRDYYSRIGRAIRPQGRRSQIQDGRRVERSRSERRGTHQGQSL